jgi:hypothetical protein
LKVHLRCAEGSFVLMGVQRQRSRGRQSLQEVSNVKKLVQKFAGAVGWLAVLMMAAGAGWKPH